MDGDLDGLLEMLAADAVAYADWGRGGARLAAPGPRGQEVANPEKLQHLGRGAG